MRVLQGEEREEKGRVRGKCRERGGGEGLERRKMGAAESRKLWEGGRLRRVRKEGRGGEGRAEDRRHSR